MKISEGISNLFQIKESKWNEQNFNSNDSITDNPDLNIQSLNKSLGKFYT